MKFITFWIFIFSTNWRLIAQDLPHKVSLEPQPVIVVEEPKVIGVPVPNPNAPIPGPQSPATGENLPVVDTDEPSPIAPQSMDGFDGQVQSPFAPTAAERQAQIKKQQEEEKKEQEIAAKKERERQEAERKQKLAELAKAKKLNGKRIASKPSQKRTLAATKRKSETPIQSTKTALAKKSNTNSRQPSSLPAAGKSSKTKKWQTL